MPRFRSDLEGLVTYVPGRPIEEVAREAGVEPSEIIKLASNENPEGPFPGVVDAVARVAAGSNRYPDTDAFELMGALSAEIGVDTRQLWLGSGSVGLLGCIAYGIGGPGTSAVYAWPSFVMYRIISRWAFAQAIEVPLDDELTHDLDAMRSAVRDDTTIVYLCNPNNPTGTVVRGDSVESFVESLPESVLVVVDEAYHDFVDDPSYRSAVPLALSRPNVVVLRTFSKIFALAAHRIGYAVGDAATLDNLRRTQAPFSVGVAAQTAALVSLGQDDELKRRVEANAQGRRHLLKAVAERELPHAVSQANFVYVKIGDDSALVAAKFTKQGIIIRPMSHGWIRVTVGLPSENEAFAKALDLVLEGGSW